MRPGTDKSSKILRQPRWEMTQVQEVVDLNPSAIYWIDMTFFTLICCKKIIVCLKRPKINEKEARVRSFKLHHLVLQHTVHETQYSE